MADAAIQKVQRACKRRRIRIAEFMRTFDSRGARRITRSQFGRALNMAGLELSAADVEVLAASFREPSDADAVRYTAFCDLVDEVFAIKGFEQCPQKEARLALSSERGRDPLGLDRPTLSDARREMLAASLHAAERRIANEGVAVKGFFDDFDRSRTGTTTKEQFVRTLSGVLALSFEEATAIAEAYACERGCDYKRFLEDVSAHGPEDDGVPDAAPRPPCRAQQDAAPEADVWPRLEGHLRYLVGKYRLRPTDFFTEADRLRTGVVARRHFVHGVRRGFTIALSTRQLEAIADRFALSDRPTDVDYVAFADCVSSPFVRGGGYTSALAADQDLDGVMRSIRDCIRRSRMTIQPVFKDFDRLGEDHVTTEQFARCLSMFGLLPETQALRSKLFAIYASEDPLRPAAEYVNYKRFLEDVTPPGDSEDAGASGAGRPAPAVRLPQLATKQGGADALSRSLRFGRKDRSVEQLLGEIRGYVYTQRVRLGDFFQPFDRLRRRRITRAQFSRGLRGTRLLASDSEVHALADRFPASGADQDGRPEVDWVAFVRDVDKAFTLQGLELAPIFDAEREASRRRASGRGSAEGGRAATGAATGAAALSGAENERLQAFLRETALKAARRRLEMGAAFRDFDHMNHGYVPRSVFERVLSMVDLFPASAEDLALLVRKFREPASDSGVDVNYKAFSRALALVAAGAGAEDLPDAASFRAAVRAGGIAPPGGSGAAGEVARTAGGEEAPSMDAIMKDIYDVVARRRVRISEFLADGDRLRHGSISAPKFRNGLCRCGVDLAEREYAALEEAFRSETSADQVDWRSFLAAYTDFHRRQL